MISSNLATQLISDLFNSAHIKFMCFVVITANDNFANHLLTFGNEVESGHIYDQVKVLAWPDMQTIQ